jgi:hypothetical protein
MRSTAGRGKSSSQVPDPSALANAGPTRGRRTSW